MNKSQNRVMPVQHDILGETLYALRLNGVIYSKSELTAPWGIDMPLLEGKMMFHIITKGGGWLRLSDQENVHLKSGDIALLPRGEGHFIANDQTIECKPFFDMPVTHVSERYELIQYGGGGEETALTCGVLSVDSLAAQKLISQLPPLIVVTREDAEMQGTLQILIQLMEIEAATLNAGGETVLANLADIIVIKVIRHWIEHSPKAKQGWLGALKDRKIGKALAVMHAHPESPWTLDTLADHAGMSRSGFSARFTQMIGLSAKQYLTEWRMGMARMKIMQSSVSLAELAAEFGYTSEAAFSRAYKRVFGVPPLREGRAEL